MTPDRARRYVEAFNRAAQAATVGLDAGEHRYAKRGGLRVQRHTIWQPEKATNGQAKKARCWPVRYRPATGFHHGNHLTPQCGVPVRTPLTRQSHQTP